MDVSESALDAVVIISKLLVIEAEEVEECGMKICLLYTSPSPRDRG